ncbi:MAG: hypothetical protein ABIV06_11680 [Thermoanaerobaculia bacterium]
MRPPSDATALPELPARASTAAGTAATDPEAEILRRFDALPEERLAVLREAAAVAVESACGLYWIGGGVRDLWLGRSELDLDLVVEGELAAFAARLAQRLGSGVRLHPQFQTAELEAPGGLRIDLALVRTESYPAPGALPVIAPGTVASDLARRDFTVNCLAIPLAPDFGGSLIDRGGGMADLRAGLLRTLHPASFRDDPTRILRALEFEARLGFDLTPETHVEAELAIATGALERLSPTRLGDAFRRALGRPASVSGTLRRMRSMALLAAIDPALERAAGAADRVDLALAARVATARLPIESTFRLALLCLTLDLSGAERKRLASRLALTAQERELATEGPLRLQTAVAGLAADPLPSVAHALLAPLADEEMAVLASQGARERAWVLREWTQLRALRLQIGGRELLAAGEAPGPALGRALELTLSARLDGRIEAAGELAFALRAARRFSGGAAS